MKAPNDTKSVGKLVRGNLYFHISAVGEVNVAAADLFKRAIDITEIKPERDFNLVKISREKSRVSLLYYARFFEDPFPCLNQSFTVDLTKEIFRHRSYDSRTNPPILHRKELMLPFQHPSRPLFASLTNALDARGIQAIGPGLGFKTQWNNHLEHSGVFISGHTVIDIESNA